MANEKPTILTKQGKIDLEKKLTYLKTIKREQVAERIRTAREFGDIFPANLEGYLLPDTYLLPLKCTGPELARIMTARFRELALPWHTTEIRSSWPL